MRLKSFIDPHEHWALSVYTVCLSRRAESQHIHACMFKQSQTGCSTSAPLHPNQTILSDTATCANWCLFGSVIMFQDENNCVKIKTFLMAQLWEKNMYLHSLNLELNPTLIIRGSNMLSPVSLNFFAM